MRKIDLKRRMREVRFTTEHTLTPDQRNKLIRDKLERARVDSEIRKRVDSQTYA